MIEALLSIGATMAGFVAGIAALHVVFSPASRLRIDVFRPYRGETWPRGVQEDDTVRFTWSRRRPARPPIRPSWSDIVVVPTADEPTPAIEPGTSIVEDTAGDRVAVRPVEGASVHQARR